MTTAAMSEGERVEYRAFTARDGEAWWLVGTYPTAFAAVASVIGAGHETVTVNRVTLSASGRILREEFVL
jgi:hypothetical protein